MGKTKKVQTPPSRKSKRLKKVHKRRKDPPPFKKKSKARKTLEDCAICLGAVHDRGEISCRHHYCYGCIKEWSKRSNTCPQCKKRFRKIKRKGKEGYRCEAVARADQSTGVSALVRTTGAYGTTFWRIPRVFEADAVRRGTAAELRRVRAEVPRSRGASRAYRRTRAAARRVRAAEPLNWSGIQSILHRIDENFGLRPVETPEGHIGLFRLFRSETTGTSQETPIDLSGE